MCFFLTWIWQPTWNGWIFLCFCFLFMPPYWFEWYFCFKSWNDNSFIVWKFVILQTEYWILYLSYLFVSIMHEFIHSKLKHNSGVIGRIFLWNWLAKYRKVASSNTSHFVNVSFITTPKMKIFKLEACLDYKQHILIYHVFFLALANIWFFSLFLGNTKVILHFFPFFSEAYTFRVIFFCIYVCT